MALILKNNKYQLSIDTRTIIGVMGDYEKFIRSITSDNVYFIDKHENITLWAEPNMEGIQIYADNVKDGFGGMTEEEAREYIWEKLSRDIVKRTINGFGNAGGISARKVQQ